MPEAGVGTTESTGNTGSGGTSSGAAARTLGKSKSVSVRVLMVTVSGWHGYLKGLSRSIGVAGGVTECSGTLVEMMAGKQPTVAGTA